jgi:hypothetical protein
MALHHALPSLASVVVAALLLGGCERARGYAPAAPAADAGSDAADADGSGATDAGNEVAGVDAQVDALTPDGIAAVDSPAADASADAKPLPLSHELMAWQTPIRNQGSRKSCTAAFAAIAALEAAYAHAGKGKLDLSEQFACHMSRTFWLEPEWSRVVARGEDGAESGVAALDSLGGPDGASSLIEWLASGLRIPAESAMPYRATEYTESDSSLLAGGASSPLWNAQANRSAFNLDPKILPLSALKAPLYYAVESFREIDPRDAAALEAELVSGREVVWDFLMSGGGELIWYPCAAGKAGCSSSRHSVLLVGYDRSAADPRYHRFIAKDSRGPSDLAGADGFVNLSYDYLAYGLAARSIEKVRDPAPWPELAFVGRWELLLDGHWDNTLDIYHLPGLMEWHFKRLGRDDKDLRLGALYDPHGVAMRINGKVEGHTIRLRFDGGQGMTQRRQVKWSHWASKPEEHELQYRMVGSPSEEIMAGFHTDDGADCAVKCMVDQYAGYARKGGALPTPWLNHGGKPTWYMEGQWWTSFLGLDGVFRFERMDSSFLVGDQLTEYTGLAGRFVGGSSDLPVQALVSNKDPRIIKIRIPELLGDPSAGGELFGKNLNFAQTVNAGTATKSSGEKSGFIMARQQ